MMRQTWMKMLPMSIECNFLINYNSEFSFKIIFKHSLIQKAWKKLKNLKNKSLQIRM